MVNLIFLGVYKIGEAHKIESLQKPSVSVFNGVRDVNEKIKNRRLLLGKN